MEFLNDEVPSPIGGRLGARLVARENLGIKYHELFLIEADLYEFICSDLIEGQFRQFNKIIGSSERFNSLMKAFNSDLNYNQAANVFDFSKMLLNEIAFNQVSHFRSNIQFLAYKEWFESIHDKLVEYLHSLPDSKSQQLKIASIFHFNLSISCLYKLTDPELIKEFIEELNQRKQAPSMIKVAALESAIAIVLDAFECYEALFDRNYEIFGTMKEEHYELISSNVRHSKNLISSNKAKLVKDTAKQSGVFVPTAKDTAWLLAFTFDLTSPLRLKEFQKDNIADLVRSAHLLTISPVSDASQIKDSELYKSISNLLKFIPENSSYSLKEKSAWNKSLARVKRHLEDLGLNKDTHLKRLERFEKKLE